MTVKDKGEIAIRESAGKSLYESLYSGMMEMMIVRKIMRRRIGEQMAATIVMAIRKFPA